MSKRAGGRLGLKETQYSTREVIPGVGVGGRSMMSASEAAGVLFLKELFLGPPSLGHGMYHIPGHTRRPSR